MYFFFTDDNLYHSKSLGSLVRDFVDAHPEDLELLESFVDGLRVMDLQNESHYVEVLEFLENEGSSEHLEIFKAECESAGIIFKPLISKTFYYYHHDVKLKVTIDTEGEVYQIFMQKKDSLGWKVLRADHAKAKTMLNNYDKLVQGANFGHYIRVTQ